MSVISTVRNDLHKFVEEVTGRAEKSFAAEKAAIGIDVRHAVAQAKADVKAATPGLTAEAEVALDALIKAAESALLAHGV
jgi:hypothetical protein